MRITTARIVMPLKISCLIYRRPLQFKIKVIKGVSDLWHFFTSMINLRLFKNEFTLSHWCKPLGQINQRKWAEQISFWWLLVWFLFLWQPSFLVWMPLCVRFPSPGKMKCHSLHAVPMGVVMHLFAHGRYDVRSVTFKDLWKPIKLELNLEYLVAFSFQLHCACVCARVFTLWADAYELMKRSKWNPSLCLI